MIQKTINPYLEIGGFVSTPTTGGLDTIIGTSPVTIEDLVTAVTDYIISVFYVGASTQVGIEVASVARTAINSYVNNLVMGGQAGYNARQFRFIELLMGNSLTSNLPLISIQDRIEDVDDNLSDNQLAVGEQTPLLLATTIGFNANIYWQNVIRNIATTPWASFITGKLQPLGSDIAYWVAAAMNGALAGYGATPSGMIEPSVNFVTNKMVSALTGALTVTAGKVMFNWIPRIQHANLSVNTPVLIGRGGMGGRVGNLDSTNKGGGQPPPPPGIPYYGLYWWNANGWGGYTGIIGTTTGDPNAWTSDWVDYNGADVLT